MSVERVSELLEHSGCDEEQISKGIAEVFHQSLLNEENWIANSCIILSVFSELSFGLGSTKSNSSIEHSFTSSGTLIFLAIRWAR